MPVVKVTTELGPHSTQGGSGVVVRSEQREDGGYDTYILTCDHVIQVRMGPLYSIWRVSYIEFYDHFTNKIIQASAKLIAHDTDKDLALIKLDTKWAFPTAQLMPPEELWRLRIDSKVLVVGSALGGLPVYTRGDITLLFKDYLEVNAPAYRGISGGACYLESNNMVIGLPNVLRTDIDGILVPHLVGVVPIYAIHKWLDEIGYEFLYNPDVSTEKQLKTPEITPREMSLETR